MGIIFTGLFFFLTTCVYALMLGNGYPHDYAIFFSPFIGGGFVGFLALMLLSGKPPRF